MKSMTGYGKISYSNQDMELEIEIKSLNNRYLDLKTMLPRELSFLELPVREHINTVIKRGKVDFVMRWRDKRLPSLTLDENRLKALATVFKRAGEMLGEQETPLLPQLLPMEVIVWENPDAEKTGLSALVMQKVDEALEAHKHMAVNEGEKMRQFLQGSIKVMQDNLTHIESCFPLYKDEMHAKIKAGVEALLKDKTSADDLRRIGLEVAFYVDKADINEEVVRLKAHLEKFASLLIPTAREQGKTLNFVLQEMHREINTVGNKFNTPAVFEATIAFKEEVEKCREMVQNVE